MRSTVASALAFFALVGASFINIGSSLALGYAGGDSYEELFLRVLDHPGDPALNKQFARDAEARGDIRHAFAALERVVLSSPGDTEAQAEFDRLRNKLMPAVTKVTVQVGASYTSNPTQLANAGSTLDEDNVLLPGSGFSLHHQQDATFDAKVTVADERTVGSLRWRSLALASGQFQGDVTPLNTQTLAVESGPVFQLTPDVWLHVAGGGAVVWLDEQKLYDDASASATIGGLYKGLTQTLTARFTWRDANVNINAGEVDDNFGDLADLNANSARIFDLEGRFVASPSFATGDLFYFQPHLQVSQNDGNPQVIYPLFFSPGGDEILNRPLFPGDFTQLGAAISYYYPLFRGTAFVGAGVEVYQRWYGESSSAIDTVGTWDPNNFVADLVDVHAGNRQDTYVEPSAHLILPNLFAPNVDLRFDYRYEHNASNASTITIDPVDDSVVKTSDSFQNHVAGVHVVGRF
jgi:hypothetical protein